MGKWKRQGERQRLLMAAAGPSKQLLQLEHIAAGGHLLLLLLKHAAGARMLLLMKPATGVHLLEHAACA